MEPIELILSKLSEVRKDNSGWSARCPSHDDRKASLSVALGDAGRVLLHCHAGCTVGDVCMTMGLRMADLYPHENNGRALGHIVATYDYCNGKGELLFL